MSDRVVRARGRRWGSGEWIGVIGIVIGIIVSLFTWWAAEKTRNLSFRLTADRAEIMKSGVSSDITAFYKGAEIKGDLIAYSFVVWNAGREPVRWAEDVLKEVTVHPADGMKLLEAKVVRTSRDEIGFTVADGTADRNNLVLKWKLLERGDGALIQVLATNAISPPFRVTGAVVGQGSLDIDSVEANDRYIFYRKLFGGKNPHFWVLLCSLALSMGVSFVFTHATLIVLRNVTPHFISRLVRSDKRAYVLVSVLLATYFLLFALAISLALLPDLLFPLPSGLLGPNP